MQATSYERILGIDPYRRGFGFVVLELNGRLIDWGLVTFPVESFVAFEARLRRLVDRYAARVLATENCSQSRKGARARRLVSRALLLAHQWDMQTVVSRAHDVRAALALHERATKHEVAERLADLLPELADYVPPKRKPWETEIERINVFDAAGFAAAAMLGLLGAH